MTKLLVDFHMHSTASDGSLSPTELAQRSAGFAAAAITDHDNTDGVKEFLAASAPRPLRFAGTELSIEPGESFDRFHLLCLGFDTENASFQTLLRRILASRNERNEKIFENFSRLGIDIPKEEINAYTGGEILARPHFARWLVDHNYAQSVKEAFLKFLTPSSPAPTRCYEKRWRAPRSEVFEIVHASGGICLMAHPKFWCNEWKNTGCDFAKVRRGLEELKEMGLDGIEARYQANSPGENDAFTRIADQLGLLKSAGSDFHGVNKPDVPIGMETPESFIAPLLERLQAPKA